MPAMDFTSGVNPLYINDPFSHVPPPADPDQSQFHPINPTFDGNTGNPWDTSGVRTYEKSWKVGVKTKSHANPLVVVKHRDLPFPYAPYISNNGLQIDPAAFAVSIDAKPMVDDDWQWWIVTVKYSTEMPDNGPDFSLASQARGWPSYLLGVQNIPWYERPTFTFDEGEMTIAEPFDRLGRAYVSSAGQPFSPPPSRRHRYPIYVFERNMPTFMVTAGLIQRYTDALNDRTFLGHPRGTVQCKSFAPGQLRYRGKITYYRIRLSFAIETRLVVDPNALAAAAAFGTPVLAATTRRTWQPWYIDQGTEVIETRTPLKTFNTPVPIIVNGQPATHPKMLDGNGQQLRPSPDGKLYPFRLEFEDFPYENMQNLFTNMG